MCLRCERAMRGSAAPFPLQCAHRRARALRTGFGPCRRTMAASVGTLRALPRFRRRCAFARRLQINARASCLREPDRNGLLRRARAMLAFADMVDLLANELACLRAGSFAFASIATRPLQRSF